MIKMLNIDCMEYMKGLPDKAFDLAIVDPPYGIQQDNLTGFKRKTIQHEHHDKCVGWDIKPSHKYFDELFRVSKNQIIWGVQYFSEFLPSFSQLIVWNKKTGKSYFADGEAAFCSIKGTLRIFEHQWCGAFKDSERQSKPIHVNQKPVALYKWLLKNYAKPYKCSRCSGTGINESFGIDCDVKVCKKCNGNGYINPKILDTHGGSGSICIACHDMGYDLTWMELDKDYYDAAVKRYKRHASQGELFEIKSGEII